MHNQTVNTNDNIGCHSPVTQDARTDDPQVDTSRCPKCCLTDEEVQVGQQVRDPTLK